MVCFRCIFLVFCFFYASSISGQQKTTIEVTGKLKGNYAGKMLLCFEDKILHKDSAEITDGNFHFTCDVSLPVLARLHLGQTSLLVDFYIDQKKVYLECTNKMNVTNSQKDTFNTLSIDSVSGSNLEEAKRIFFQKLNISYPNEVNTKDTLEYFNTLNAFVEQNTKSKVAAYLIPFSSHLSYPKVYSLYKKLDTSLNNTYEMKRVVSFIDSKEWQTLGIRNEGMPFHDVTLSDMDGKEVNTKDIKGGYILMNIWASWCKPCREENPGLRNVYEKYKDKGLTMIGISFDRSTSKWIDAVKQDSLPWIQLIDVNGFSKELAKYYRIGAVPTFFLLDKNRKIIKVDSLEEILKRLDILMTLSKKD